MLRATEAWLRASMAGASRRSNGTWKARRWDGEAQSELAQLRGEATVTAGAGVMTTAGGRSSELKLLLLRIDVTGCGAAANGGGASRESDQVEAVFRNHD